ncbi:hypothetical protein Ahy_A03g015999 [Arachis hypogaea]|uniref:DYW domain-containing protein n=1 Tax=Arachis hypogaea TaxID=3818 RepID=A0A445E1S6_ARAHY|nr:hypothetical protein Ahy_A03g015999 [Arachis hypogaea]
MASLIHVESLLQKCNSLIQIKQFQAHLITTGKFQSHPSRTKLIELCALSPAAGNLSFAAEIFRQVNAPKTNDWNAILRGLAQSPNPTNAITWFRTISRSPQKIDALTPDEVTVLGALSACSQLGAVRQGEIVHRYIVDEKLDMNGIVCNALIDMYGKCGFVDKAYLVFNKMSCKKTLITWNTMIMAFAMNGDGYKALDLLDQMVLEGMLPDDVSYLSALCACNHAGLVEEGVRLLDTMIECRVKPNVKHYGTVVDLLGRAGRLQEAYDIINSMPMMPDIVFWQTLLGASKTYGNVEMAEIASKKLVEMGSNASGDFVLLSNVYAAQQRWHDVGRVRETMKNSDVRKVPGFSYTEIDGNMHKFVNADQSHPNSKEIYMKLDEIRFKIKAYGYDAETNLVLHDIGDEDKENVLNFHSEKLAVAYSLISTRDGTPIHVIKNLRICVDCHAVLKIISKIYSREIIVRDRARFHRFKEGECSCRDYW